MTTYNDYLINWLEEDKLDAPISIRWTTKSKFYTTRVFVTSTWDKTVTCWFRPKAIYIRAIFEDFDASAGFSQTYTIENNDGTITTSGIRREGNTMYSLWTWASTSIEAVYLDSTHYMFVTLISNTWFTLGNSDFDWEDWYLHITVFW